MICECSHYRGSHHANALGYPCAAEGCRCTGWRPAPAVTPPPRDGNAWLVESDKCKPGSVLPLWLSADETGSGTFTPNANDARRFDSRADAERCIAARGFQAKATEHLWMAPRDGSETLDRAILGEAALLLDYLGAFRHADTVASPKEMAAAIRRVLRADFPSSGTRLSEQEAERLIENFRDATRAAFYSPLKVDYEQWKQVARASLKSALLGTPSIQPPSPREKT